MRPSALLFDLDGTITEPMLDFPAIKREMGIGDRPILESMAQMNPEQLRRAQQIPQRHEDRAAAESQLNPGCDELMSYLHRQNIPVAIITRNSRRSAGVVLSRHSLRVDALVTRDDGLFKPDPAPLLRACAQLRCEPRDAWMIGDGQFDVEAGIAAGMKTVWLSHGRQRAFAVEPWRTIRDLPELLNLLQKCVSD